MAERTHRQILSLTCIDALECSVVVEPLGVELRLSSDDEFRVEVECPAEDEFGIAYSPGCISLYHSAATNVWIWNRLGECLFRYAT